MTSPFYPHFLQCQTGKAGGTIFIRSGLLPIADLFTNDLLEFFSFFSGSFLLRASDRPRGGGFLCSFTNSFRTDLTFPFPLLRKPHPQQRIYETILVSRPSPYSLPLSLNPFLDSCYSSMLGKPSWLVSAPPPHPPPPMHGTFPCIPPPGFSFENLYGALAYVFWATLRSSTK